ncbi:MAG: TraB/VirB10 family protein [Oligoflexia bacterium]|nr:TraB/VirB10 family protein [Oligoflexia bacterium]
MMESAKAIKRKQILLVVLGVGGFTLTLIFGMWLADPNRGKPSALELQKDKTSEVIKDYRINSNNVVTPEENWIALSEKEMSGLKLENNDLKRKLEELSGKLNTLEKKESFDLSKPLPSVNDKVILPPSPLLGMKSHTVTMDTIAAPKLGAMNDHDDKEVKAPNAIDVIDLSEEKAVGEVKQKKNNIASFIPAGSFAKVVLISGVDAPTGGLAQKNPMPVLMKLLDHGRLPNHFKSRIKDCHATGAASGDISSERACIRLEKLACVLESGDVIETAIQGFVTGEDGKNCFRGNLVSKQGSLIAQSALAGLFSGLGNAISNQYKQVATSPLGSVQTVDPNKIGEAGLASGASTALEKIADFYLARANETYPIIEVDANRRGELVLTNGIDLENEILKTEEKEKE